MTDKMKRLLWVYRCVFTQTNAGGGTVFARFIANETMEILYVTIGKDDYAANRDVTGRLTDGTNVIGIVMPTTAADDQMLTIPVAASTADAGQQSEKSIILAQGDELQILTGSLVQTETLTIAIRALVSSVKPTVSVTGSGGTVTQTVTYNTVI